MGFDEVTYRDLLQGAVLVPEEGAWCMKVTEWGHHLHVRRMIPPNWRLVVVASHNEWDGCLRAWCYSGASDDLAKATALLAARAWDGDPATEPEGWVKQAWPVTGRRRPDGDAVREYVAP
jgi:hypothetical protein